MFNKSCFSGIRLDRIRWMVACLIGMLMLLSTTFVASVALAYSYDTRSKGNMPSLALPASTALTPTLQVGSTATYTFSLTTLGYDEVTLTSPYGNARYSFRLPENWTIQTDGILDLDLSYAYNQVNIGESPVLFGDLTVTFDGQTLEIFPIKEELDHYQIRVPLPSSLLANPDRIQHAIGLALNAGFLCEIPHRAALVIHPTSSISITYAQRPLIPNLARYPRPFYQQAFEPDSVRFVLPSQLTANDLTSALDVAAKLDDLTGNRMVISATTDVDLKNLLSTTATAFDEHLIVIGQPRDNQLLPLLNDIVELPVSMYQQQLKLVTQGPATVTPGGTVTYVFTITNTIDDAANLSLVDPLPAYTELVSCTVGCTKESNGHIVTWSNNTLAPDETVSLSLTLKASDLLTGTIFENTVTLLEADLGPVNADTLTSTVVTGPFNHESKVSVAGEGDYFFVHDGKAVASGDGVIQEILSPWSGNRAILIITGLSDEAVRKASQAMSSETRFPGMSGAVALVRDALPSSEIEDTTSRAFEMTLEDLGYLDEIIQGISEQQVDYFFEVPYEWQLANDAAIDLYFSHSEIIDYTNSGLTVLINNEPVASVNLSDETASDGHLHINLADTDVRSGRGNRLTVRADMSLSQECVNPNTEQAWLLIKNKSKIFLAHEVTALSLDLDYFPYPFHANRGLTDLLFALPSAPNRVELEAALRLVGDIGNSAAGKTIVPAAMLGSNLPFERLRDYHIIAIGRPSRNALIQQINTQLPQPFLPGSDQIEQHLDDVVLRLPPEADLGYLQLIPSPWKESRAFLAVTGTSDEGMSQASHILTDSPWVLKGDLALIKDGDVHTIDTRTLTKGGFAVAVATAVPAMTPVVTPTTIVALATPLTNVPLSSPTPAASTLDRISKNTNRPVWLTPLVGVTGLVIIAILIIGFWRPRRRRSSSGGKTGWPHES